MLYYRVCYFYLHFMCSERETSMKLIKVIFLPDEKQKDNCEIFDFFYKVNCVCVCEYALSFAPILRANKRQ